MHDGIDAEQKDNNNIGISKPYFLFRLRGKNNEKNATLEDFSKASKCERLIKLLPLQNTFYTFLYFHDCMTNVNEQT